MTQAYTKGAKRWDRSSVLIRAAEDQLTATPRHAEATYRAVAGVAVDPDYEAVRRENTLKTMRLNAAALAKPLIWC